MDFIFKHLRYFYLIVYFQTWRKRERERDSDRKKDK